MTAAASSPDSAIAFIGGGNMARSLIGGLIRAGTPAASIRVGEPSTQLADALARDFDIATGADNAAAARGASLWVLAVKPQVMREVCLSLREVAVAQRPLIVSTAAGIRVDQVARWLGADLPIVRCMPNTPALIGAGATGLFANARADAGQRAAAERVLGALGFTTWIGDEALMDTVTALSGSGPAYFFLLVEALENAAAAQGMARVTARALAIQTCLGAARMLAESDVAPDELRRRVTSPGGTTQAALDAFEAGGFDGLVAQAVAAATQRGAQMSAQLDDGAGNR